MDTSRPEAAPGGTAPVPTNLFACRLMIGIVQGMLLYFLIEAARPPHSAMLPIVFFPLLLVIVYIAPVIEIGIGRLRTSRLVLWSALLAVVVAMLGFHDAWRTVEPTFSGNVLWNAGTERFPSFQVTFFSGLMIFIGYTLILAGESAKTWFAPY